jgi:hypothetical protein
MLQKSPAAPPVRASRLSDFVRKAPRIKSGTGSHHEEEGGCCSVRELHSSAVTFARANACSLAFDRFVSCGFVFCSLEWNTKCAQNARRVCNGICIFNFLERAERGLRSCGRASLRFVPRFFIGQGRRHRKKLPAGSATISRCTAAQSAHHTESNAPTPALRLWKRIDRQLNFPKRNRRLRSDSHPARCSLDATFRKTNWAAPGTEIVMNLLFQIPLPRNGLDATFRKTNRATRQARGWNSQ